MNDTTTTNTATTPAADAPAPQTVIDNMESRRIFPNVDEATAYITKCQAEISDFANFPAITVGFTEDGEFDPEVYSADMEIAVAVLTQKGATEGAKMVAKAIVIYPTPKIDAILGSTQGRDWLTAIMQKEANHVAMRALRKATTPQEMADALDGMPKTVADYFTGRESTGGATEVYGATWQNVKKAIGQKFKAFANRNFSRKELRKAIESKSYAAAVYGPLEDRSVSLFVLAAQFGAALAKKDGLDPAFYERALTTRDETVIDIEGDDDEGTFDIDAMLAEVSKPATAETPATDGPLMDQTDDATAPTGTTGA